jgi:AcrR family transcriptional regulator
MMAVRSGVPERERPARKGPGRYDRASTPEKRRAEQRRALIAAALEVFATKGYASTSVGAIVRRARMSRRTFYEHFAGLADALLAAYDLAVSVLYSHVERAVRGRDDPIEKLHAGVDAYLTMFGHNAALTRVLYREIRAAGPAHAARHQASVARFVALFMEAVSEAHVRGVASRPADELTAFALISSLEAVGSRYIERGEETRILEASPAMVELVLRAFR